MHLRLGALVFYLFFLASLPAAESVEQEVGGELAAQEIKKSVEPAERTSAQEVLRESAGEMPPAEEKEVVPPAEKLAEGTAAPQEKSIEMAPIVSQEAEQQPADQKGVGEGPAPEPEPKVTEKDTGTLFSAEEGERARVGKPYGGGESLFSIDEAEKARKEKLDVHKEMQKQTEDKDVTLFSVDEAEKAAVGRPVTPSKEKVQGPITTERETKDQDKGEREKVSVRRRKDKEEWTKIELGFGYKDVTLNQGSYSFETHFIGEMVNGTGRDYGIVKFMFSAFDKRGKLITEEPFQITDFYVGQIKTFSGTVIDSYKEIASHKIRFISAAPTARE